MAIAGITGAIDLTTAAKNSAHGGLAQSIYLGNIDDLSSFPTETAGVISALAFATGGALYKYTGVFKRSTAGSDASRNPAGAGVYNHSVVMALITENGAKKVQLEELVNADSLFAIVEYPNDRFEVYGLPDGMVVESAPYNSGEVVSADVARIVTLSGEGRRSERIFLDTDFASTKTLLEGYLTPAA